jgi:hypothetical protein
MDRAGATEKIRNLRHLVGALLLGLAACAGPSGTPFPEVSVPPVPPDRGRIYFYRDYEPYESLSQASLYLNGARVGVSVSGGFFYRDVMPATYAITAWTQKDFPDASKTVTLRAGDTIYAKVESFRGWEDGGGDSNFARDTFVVMIIDPVQAQSELNLMRYVQADEGPR